MKNYIYYCFLFIASIIHTSPASVTSGGTGLSAAPTAFTVLCGGTTSINPLQTTANAGTSGQPLISAGAGALPAYGTLSIAGGGTGATSLSSGVISSNGSVLSSLGIGSTEQVLQNVAGTVGWAFTNILQMVSTSTSAAIDTAGTNIPDDNSIPQITEGTLILSQAITPKSASSNLLIFFAVGGTPATDNASIIAFFVDATADAFAAQYISQSATSQPYSGVLVSVVPSGSTTSRTYHARIGTATTTGGYKINATSAGSQVFNGVASTTLTIFEFT